MLKIFQGKCGKLRGIAGPQCAQMREIARVKIPLPRNTVRIPRSGRLARGGKCGEMRA